MSRLGYRLHDKIVGTNILKTERFLEESQWWDETEMYEFRTRKFIALVHYAIENVPFYKEYSKKKNLRISNFKSLEDIEKLPIINKQIVRSNPEQFQSMKINYKSRSINKGSTGGTTGAPMKLYRTKEARNWIWGSYYRWYSWMGINMGDKIAVLWGQPIVPKKLIHRTVERLINNLKNIKRFDTFQTSSRRLLELIQEVNSFGPKLIHGYSHSVSQFALTILENNIEFHPPIASSYTAEPMMEYQREIVGKAFGSLPYDQYACGEVNSIAFECEIHQGLHVSDEHCLVEINKDNSTIVVTDFDNYALPLLRYDTGDISKKIQGRCKCGRNLSRIDHVEGRSGSMILCSNGELMHPEFFTHLLKELGIYDKYSITKYQVIQENIETLRWKIVSNKHFAIDDMMTINNKCSKYLGDVEINFEFVDDIPSEKSGKFIYVKSDLVLSKLTSH